METFWMFLPPLVPLLNPVSVDLVASMTETQAIAVYQRIEGITLDAGLDKILV
jgi:hypothetical protein